jgi:hypothetical protein
MTIAALSWPEATVYATAIASVGLIVAVLIWSIFRTGQAAIRSERKTGVGDPSLPVTSAAPQVSDQ